MKLVLLLVLTPFLFFTNVNALSFPQTYSNLTPNNSITKNLINYANTFYNFVNSHYVCFRENENDYYLVWGSLNLDNNVVTGSNIEYIKYSSIIDLYSYGKDSNFSLTSDHINTSNIRQYGFRSELFLKYQIFEYIKIFLIVLTGFGLVIMFRSLRRNQKLTLIDFINENLSLEVHPIISAFMLGILFLLIYDFYHSLISAVTSWFHRN